MYLYVCDVKGGSGSSIAPAFLNERQVRARAPCYAAAAVARHAYTRIMDQSMHATNDETLKAVGERAVGRSPG